MRFQGLQTDPVRAGHPRQRGQLRLATQAHLGAHQRDADEDAEQDVDQQEGTATIGPGEVGEPPDVPQANGESRRRHDEPENDWPRFRAMSAPREEIRRLL